MGFSPDGRFLLYCTNGNPKTGYDLWILPDPLSAPGADGKEVFYLAPDQRLMAAQVSIEGGEFETGEVHPRWVTASVRRIRRRPAHPRLHATPGRFRAPDHRAELARRTEEVNRRAGLASNPIRIVDGRRVIQALCFSGRVISRLAPGTTWTRRRARLGCQAAKTHDWVPEK